MKIYSFADWNVPCTYTTLAWGVQGLKNYLNADVHIYSYNELINRTINIDTDNNVLLIFEIGNPQHAGLNTYHLRQWFPNAKLIALCGDTQYYQFNNLNPQIDPNGIDLHLEITLSGVEWLKSKGAIADWWHWSISEQLIELATNYKKISNKTSDFVANKKQFDFIGVFHPNTINNTEGWRHHAIKHIIANNLSFTNGGGDGHYDNDLYRLFEHYICSWFTFGTTSHNHPLITKNQSAKFFRDELGPILDSLLIYNNCELISKIYGADLLPLYDYDNYQSIIELYHKYKDTDDYYRLLNLQKEWVVEHSFEKELLIKLLEHKIIKKEDIKCM